MGLTWGLREDLKKKKKTDIQISTMEVGYLTVWLKHIIAVSHLYLKSISIKIKQPVDVSVLLLLATIIYTFQKEKQLI